MAERLAPEREHTRPTALVALSPAGWRPLGPVRAYLLLAGMWMRAAWQYRASLALLTVAQACASGLDFVAILLLFTHVRALAGFSLPEVMFLYGTSALAFGLSDLLFSSVEALGYRIRSGSFDAMLVRPVSALTQVCTDEFSPKRFGKVAQALAVLVVALTRLRLDWTPGRAAMVLAMVVCGAAIFGAVWVLQAAFQFVATDAREVMNVFTYGGQTLTQYPLVLYGREAMRALTFTLPLAFVNWQPALWVLGHPDPLGLPTAVRFASPAVALVMAGVAGLAWRAGIRRYRSTGS